MSTVVVVSVIGAVLLVFVIVQVGAVGGCPFLTLPVPPHVGHFSQSHGTLDGGAWT